MIEKVIILFVVSKVSFAQLNGEFWWLSDKVTKLKGKQPSLPKFEELSEFDTDESAKIIFRDDDLFSTENKLDISNPTKNQNTNNKPNSIDGAAIVWPDDTLADSLPSFMSEKSTTQHVASETKQANNDVFLFKFPEDEKFVTKYPSKTKNFNESALQNNIGSSPRATPKNNGANPKKESFPKKNHSKDVFAFRFPEDDERSQSPEKFSQVVAPQNNFSVNVFDDLRDNELVNLLDDEKEVIKSSHAQSICSYMKKDECYKRNGVIYNSDKFNSNNALLSCCILPLSSEESQRIIFPDSKRYRRSTRNKEESINPSLNQRDILLRQRFRPQNVKPTSQTKIVTPGDDEYVDPYWNIKSSGMKKPNTHSSGKQDYNYPDYVEDYVVELPRPGLVGLYSDNVQRPSWSFNENSKPSYGASVGDSDEDYGITSFGYSTIDPRVTSGGSKRGRPLKLTTTPPDDEAFNEESQTVNFQSSPNFQVLPGFKLPNLSRNQNNFFSKNTRRSTTEVNFENIDSDKSGPKKHTSTFTVKSEEQVYDKCGKTTQDNIDRNEESYSTVQFGEATSGSQPWLALVVLSRKPQGILCYATIIHLRAAVTAGDCVYGRTSPKEVILIAGMWNLSDRSNAQNRVVTVQLHPQYRPKILAHNLAILHWKTPIRLNANVQPACLGSFRDTDDCKFVGWGGFDQAIRSRSRWQRASTQSAQECVSQLTKAITLPNDAFCATVRPRGTVTGIGGPLICNVDGRKTVSGVAVWRDNALVLIPAQEWILRAFQDLDLELSNQ